MPLKVNTLSKRYGNNWVLKDASFEAFEGEILGIFGPTGSGKGTVLKIVSGHEAAHGGSIFWQDREVTKLNSAERDFSTYPISEGTGLRSLLGLSKPAGSKADAIEKAIENSTNVLLLDDPFCGFDTILRKATIEKLRLAVKERHLTVLFATADYDQIFEICDRVAILVNQEIPQQGTPQEVYDRPSCVSVAEIVGRNNILSSRRLTSSKSDHPEFMTLPGEHRLFAERADIKVLGAINKNVRLAIRPENISISFGASFPEDNLLKAIVTDVKPLGASTLVKLDSNGLKLEALVVRLVGLNVGEECMIGLPPDRIQVLPY
ncbi:MAG: ABC transporter ATP-binding protein [Acidobacteriota bacterium]